jgi:hypothetical protein
MQEGIDGSDSEYGHSTARDVLPTPQTLNQIPNSYPYPYYAFQDTTTLFTLLPVIPCPDIPHSICTSNSNYPSRCTSSHLEEQLEGGESGLGWLAHVHSRVIQVRQLMGISAWSFKFPRFHRRPTRRLPGYLAGCDSERDSCGLHFYGITDCGRTSYWDP